MKGFSTKYGNIEGISTIEVYPDGSIKECILEEYFEIETNYGTFIPKYKDEDVSRPDDDVNIKDNIFTII